MLLGMTNRLRISTAASPTDDHLCNSFDGPAECKSTLNLASWRKAVERLMCFFADMKKKKKKSLFGAEIQLCDLFVSWKITFRFWNHILDEEVSPELERVGLLKKK